MFRSLCLDGGIKGIFTAAVLKRIEELSKNKIADHFDLICGTSTAEILAIAIGLGLTPAELLEFYRQGRPVIFPSTRLVERRAAQFLVGRSSRTTTCALKWSPF